MAREGAAAIASRVASSPASAARAQVSVADVAVGEDAALIAALGIGVQPVGDDARGRFLADDGRLRLEAPRLGDDASTGHVADPDEPQVAHTVEPEPGEPWCGACTEPAEPSKVRYGTVPTLSGAHAGVFNGTYRDAIKGGTRDRVMNYMGGAGNAIAVALGARGSSLPTKSTAALPDPWAAAFAYDPEQSINYVSAHDDLDLYDKITYEQPP